jgi:hypothetical protein
MSIINILTRETPKIAGYEFDAILEDTLEVSNELTGYAVEFGARAQDHAITNPFRWTLTVAISNNPLKVQLSDFVGAASYISDAAGTLTSIAGLSAGFLAGSKETRASSALEFLVGLATSKQRFDISAGDIDLTDMIVRKVTRKKDAENENALIAVVELQQLITLATIASNQPTLQLLNPQDPSYTSNAATANKGEVVGGSVSDSTNLYIDGLL